MNRYFRNVSKAIDIIRKAAGGDMETQGIAILFAVMSRDPDPLLVKDLMNMVGVSHGSTIRYLRLLGSDDNHPRGGECLGFLQSTQDSSDKRRKLVTLSAKGRRLRAELNGVLGRD